MSNHPHRSKNPKVRHLIRGDFVRDDGTINVHGPKQAAIYVDAIGLVYWADMPDWAYDHGGNPHEPVRAERWGDGDYLGRMFRPDAGEFERCGIAISLCGSAQAKEA